MNILILNWKDIHHPQVGGAEIIVYELAKRLIKSGHQVTWFCRHAQGLPDSELIDGINIVRRGNTFSVYLYAPLYYWGLKTKPDIVIDMSNTIFWQTPLWAFKSKKFAYLNQLAQEVFDYEYDFPWSKIGKMAEKLQYLTYKSTPVLCYSSSTKADLVSMGIPASHIHTFPLGLDHSRYTPGKKSPTPLFICVNRLVKMKRTDLVIKAMDIVRQTHPAAKLVIVGTGYERPHLEKLRNDLNLQTHVSFADEQVWYFSKDAKDKKVQLMQQAWALVFPSVKEGWGMTVTECAACGTPSIVTDVTGLRDSVIKDRTGLVVSANPTPSELALAMRRIVIHDTQRQKLSSTAYSKSKTLNWDTSFNYFSWLLTETKLNNN